MAYFTSLVPGISLTLHKAYFTSLVPGFYIADETIDLTVKFEFEFIVFDCCWTLVGHLLNIDVKVV